MGLFGSFFMRNFFTDVMARAKEESGFDRWNQGQEAQMPHILWSGYTV